MLTAQFALLCTCEMGKKWESPGAGDNNMQS